MIIFISDHTYARLADPTPTEVIALKKTICELNNNNKQLKAKKRKLEKTLVTCEQALESCKDNINTSDEKWAELVNKARNVPKEIYHRLEKRFKTDSTFIPPYSEELREFALTLHNTSPAAYR